MDSRLTLISSMVQPCERAADIGTDHGMLICDLVEHRMVKYGTASDINSKPLAKAQQEIALRGLGERIKTICTDGLQGIDRQDAVVIAGMGGELIAEIIDRWEHAKSKSTWFYLQPMTKAERLREWLAKSGYEVAEERCCIAVGRAYVVLRAVYTGRKIDYPSAWLYLGEIDPSRGDAEREYLLRMSKKLATKVRGLHQGGADISELDYWQAIIDEAERRLKQ